MKQQTFKQEIMNMSLSEAEQKLMDAYENTYELEDLKFIPPQNRIVDNFTYNFLQKVYSKMQDKSFCQRCNKNIDPSQVVLKGSSYVCPSCQQMTQGLECDWWIAVIGGEGTGKSTYTANLLYTWCQITQKDYIEQVKNGTAFDDFDMIRMMTKMDLDSKYNIIWADEGANVFFNRDSQSQSRKWAIKFSNAFRSIRFFTAICSVELRQLDTIIRDHRIKTLIRIQEQGIYHFYNYDQILKLLFQNKNARDSNFNWKLVEPEHVGSFSFNPETKKVVDTLKRNYGIRTQMEAKQEWTHMLRKKLFKIENTKEHIHKHKRFA